MSTASISRPRKAMQSALVIDDDVFMLTHTSEMLRELGVPDVKTARNGAEGRAAFDCMPGTPDIVFSDLMMPDSDGFQMMQWLAERDYKGGVVVVSGTDNRTLKSASLTARFHRLNFLACIPKPLDAVIVKRLLAEGCLDWTRA